MSRFSRHYPDAADSWANLPRYEDFPAVRAVRANRCLCSHAKSQHYIDRKGRPTCGSAACGCISFRPKESA